VREARRREGAITPELFWRELRDLVYYVVDMVLVGGGLILACLIFAPSWWYWKERLWGWQYRVTGWKVLRPARKPNGIDTLDWNEEDWDLFRRGLAHPDELPSVALGPTPDWLREFFGEDEERPPPSGRTEGSRTAASES
jgi:hypothetical protein